MDIKTDSGAKRNILDDADLFARHVLSCELGALPWSLTKANGQLVKTTKPQLSHLQEKSASSASDVLPNAALVLDFMAVLQSAVPLGNTFASLAYPYPIKSIMANVVSGGRVYLVIDQ